MPPDGIEPAQRVILDELIATQAHLSEPELALIVSDPSDTRDALLELRAAGLVHEHGAYWWATRAAVRFAALGYSR
jgi:hypothetical protein